MARPKNTTETVQITLSTTSQVKELLEELSKTGFYGKNAAPYNDPAPGLGWIYRPEAGIGLEPVQFHRLGQIPNDLGVASETPAAGAPPR